MRQLQMYPITTVIDSYPTQQEATTAMHAAALRIRKRGVTRRYGVHIEQRVGAWWLCLTDRG